MELMLFIVILTKVLHLSFLYAMFFIGARIAENNFIDTVYVKGLDPPSLASIVSGVFLIDFVFCAFIVAATYASFWRYATTINASVLGARSIVWAVALDLLTSWKLAFTASAGAAWVVGNTDYFYTKDDGLRGARAWGSLSWAASFVFCLPPYFLLDI